MYLMAENVPKLKTETFPDTGLESSKNDEPKEMHIKTHIIKVKVKNKENNLLHTRVTLEDNQ